MKEGLPERIEAKLPTCPHCGEEYEANEESSYTYVPCICGYTFEAEEITTYISRPLEQRK